MSCLLEAQGLGYSTHRGVALLREVSFGLHRGETLAVVGPSGSGKTSLLRCLNRLAEPTMGRLRLHEQDYDNYPVTELRRKVGLVFQLPALFPGTVMDNAVYGPRLQGVEVEQTTKLARKALEAVDLGDRVDQQADTLSVGQAQRLCLARALANGPEVLLLDEPTAALDRRSARTIETLLLRLKTEWDLAWVVVSHDEAQGLRLADRALRLVKGRMVAEGLASEVLEGDRTDEGSGSQREAVGP